MLSLLHFRSTNTRSAECQNKLSTSIHTIPVAHIRRAPHMTPGKQTQVVAPQKRQPQTDNICKELQIVSPKSERIFRTPRPPAIAEASSSNASKATGAIIINKDSCKQLVAFLSIPTRDSECHHSPFQCFFRRTRIYLSLWGSFTN